MCKGEYWLFIYLFIFIKQVEIVGSSPGHGFLAVDGSLYLRILCINITISPN